ncbi:MAG: hypothetical protein K9K66_19150 [Desulfarculaceae bacterium]|nr:hypothetical protein [Desulfarculaceae bacterium]MCF8074099.1 hypothetical protein [Desulfarculaceae bacterium]MCF8103778.1 hypothetical protein [Desulfarculaceae bacterium]MCF8116833.1 hypothetical protein [Desulfarculaceae bacterium]
MMTWDQLKARPDLIGRIDWEITPAQAFEAFQIKSTEAHRHRGLGEVLYFYLSTWRGERRVLLIERTYTSSEELAEAPAPAELMERAALAGEGQDMPRGQLPLSPELTGWLRKELGAA